MQVATDTDIRHFKTKCKIYISFSNDMNKTAPYNGIKEGRRKKSLVLHNKYVLVSAVIKQGYLLL